ncbi:hypothetical protein Spea_3307 [Shewanella pealeana ATCC 700345]|uniref:Uncharacterized protein n=1 Tax=Shewanella pealeana (strain ATCC 700345 / ANG-SQ1) TaxID=398579 RepID=A8H7T5_SHEPA|nr:hypothetical protein Spea_3307 [Shewanella pealeana ATCC 700345]
MFRSPLAYKHKPVCTNKVINRCIIAIVPNFEQRPTFAKPVIDESISQQSSIEWIAAFVANPANFCRLYRAHYWSTPALLLA